MWQACACVCGVCVSVCGWCGGGGAVAGTLSLHDSCDPCQWRGSVEQEAVNGKLGYKAHFASSILLSAAA